MPATRYPLSTSHYPLSVLARLTGKPWACVSGLDDDGLIGPPCIHDECSLLLTQPLTCSCLLCSSPPGCCRVERTRMVRPWSCRIGSLDRTGCRCLLCWRSGRCTSTCSPPSSVSRAPSSLKWVMRVRCTTWPRSSGEVIPHRPSLAEGGCLETYANEDLVLAGADRGPGVDSGRFSGGVSGDLVACLADARAGIEALQSSVLVSFVWQARE